MSYRKEPVIRSPFQPKYSPSMEQAAIFNELKFGDANIQVGAVAGSGKSTLLKWICVLTDIRNVGLMAFNSDIVKELLPHTPEYVDVKTCHAMGYNPLRKRFNSRVKDKGASKTRVILHDYSIFNPEGKSGKQLSEALSLRSEMENLVSKIKVTLTDWNDEEKIGDLICRYGIDLGIHESASLELLPAIMKKSVEQTGWIDFDDMMWLPIQYDLPLWKYDLLMVDEAQDLNKLMQEYASRISGGRVVIVGDERQSIYGFSGADTKSFGNLKERFNSEEYPLATCYRCGSDIIAEAQKINPVIQAHESTGTGEVRSFNASDNPYDYTDLPEGGLILSRRNASLVKPCFELIKKGRKAIIKGREIGVGLVQLIEMIGDCSVMEFESKLGDWQDEKIESIMKKKNPSQSSIDYVNDQAGALLAISEGCRDTSDMKNKINMIFQKDSKSGVVCSSIHKSKGLEAEHVAIIDYGRVRLSHEKMTEDEHQQEANLHYVALTRAKKKLDLVTY